MKIGIVGGGIAGTAAAWQFAQNGHDVTLFEQAAKCGPVGAGILLQPSGQRVLARLGILDEVISGSSRINALHAQHRSGRELVHLEYRKLRDTLFGLGVLRGHVFSILLERCKASGVTIVEGRRVTSYKESSTSLELLAEDGQRCGEFDIVVAADGSRSALREASGLIRSVTEYPEAALWMTGPWHGDQHRLLQLVDKTGRLVGILPLGQNRCSYFWGITRPEYNDLRERGLDEWKDQARAFYEPASEILDQIHSFDDMTFATYRNVRMRRVVSQRMAFIGDAAHATSPHLGQGANLALEDAECLANAIGTGCDHEAAFAAYEASRKGTVRYYTTLTGYLTPFFQTTNRIQQALRNVALPIMPRLPFVGGQMVLTMAGLKRGWFQFSDENMKG
ncbi:MAG: FAD-dependent oxidoreductase [Planctomycetaceae bacterium]